MYKNEITLHIPYNLICLNSVFLFTDLMVTDFCSVWFCDWYKEFYQIFNMYILGAASDTLKGKH